MRFKQFGMTVVMLLLTFAIGGFGCSSSSISSDDLCCIYRQGDLKAVAPADFSASTNLALADGEIGPSGDPYSFILTGDVELPEGATADGVTYEWTTVNEDIEGVEIKTPNEKSTAVEILGSVTGRVEFKLTVTYGEESDEAVTTVKLTSGILYVNDAADGSNGSSWDSALAGSGETMNLQNLIDTAGEAIDSTDLEAVELWVKAGTYLPTWNWGAGDAKKSSFRLRNGVSVIGGFAGDESSKSARVKSTESGRIYFNETILSGDLNKDDDLVMEVPCETVVAGDSTGEGESLRIPLKEKDVDCSEEGAYVTEIAKPSSYAENVIHILYHNDEPIDKTAILDGVVIKGGNASPTSDDNRNGGGIYNSGPASPTIISTIVENNRAREGGGIYNTKGASPTIISSIIQYNHAYNGGGIATNDGSSPKIESSIIQYNYAKQKGGGIYTWENSQSHVTAYLIKSNYAEGDGGGVSELNSDSFYRASVIKNNSAKDGAGGGFYSTGSGTVTTITSSIIQSNFAFTECGGIRIGYGATLGLVNSAVIENISGSSGAGIVGLNGMRRIQIYNSIVSDNISYRADLAKRIEIDSNGNNLDETLVFSSIVKSVPAEDSTVSESKVTFYNMLDGTSAPTLAEIDFGSYIGKTGETYTLPNPITNVKSIAPNSAYSNAGVTVGVDAEGDDFYYQDPAEGGEDTWYDFENGDVSRPADLTIITGRDIHGNVDAGNPDIGPVIMPALN
ncbi:MAG: right-handed parallel beta-helix repeat-containing protein [Nitrospinota bacterium]